MSETEKARFMEIITKAGKVMYAVAPILYTKVTSKRLGIGKSKTLLLEYLELEKNGWVQVSSAKNGNCEGLVLQESGRGQNKKQLNDSKGARGRGERREERRGRGRGSEK